MANPEDTILVQRALQADPEGFGELCRRYYPSLVAVADSILLDSHLAEDAAQEALTDACRKLAQLRKPERFGAWVAAICRNVARDMLRQRLRPVQAAAEQQSDCPDDEQKAALAEAFGKLPQHLREVIYLRYYNEMSYKQMTAMLGATRQTIDGRLRRAKKKISAYLMRKGFER